MSSTGGYGAQYSKSSRMGFSTSSQLSKASSTFVNRTSQQQAHNGNFGAISSSSTSSSSNSYSNHFKVDQTTQEMSFSNKKLIDETVVSVLSRYPKLKAVDLSRNRITTIPKGMPTHLVALDLSHNHFSSIAGMNRVSKLIEVKLTHNKISSMEGLSGAPLLQHIDLSHNRISAIEGTELLKDLRTLNLAHNAFKHLVNLRGLTFNLKLESLNLLHNDVIVVQSYKLRVKNLIPSLVELDGVLLKSHNIPSYKGLHSPPKLQDSSSLLESALRDDVNSAYVTGSGTPSQHPSSFAADTSLQSNKGNRNYYYLNLTRGYTIESDDDDESEEELYKSKIPWRNPPKVAPRTCVWKGKDIRVGDQIGDSRAEFHYAIGYNLAVNKLHADMEGLTPEQKRRGVSAKTRWMSPDHARKTALHSPSSSSSSVPFKDGVGGIINHPLPIEYDPSLSLRNNSGWSPPLPLPSSSIYADGTEHSQQQASTYTPLRQSKLDQLVSMGPMSNSINLGKSNSNSYDNNRANNDGNNRNHGNDSSFNGVYGKNVSADHSAVDVRGKKTIGEKQQEIESKIKQLNSLFNQNHGNSNDDDGSAREYGTIHQGKSVRYRQEEEVDEVSAIYRQLDDLDSSVNQKASLSPALAAISPISLANEESALTLNMKTPPPSRIRYDTEGSEVDDDDNDGGSSSISAGNSNDHYDIRGKQGESPLEASVVTPSGKAIAHAIQELMDKKKRTLAALNSARLNRKL